jgi:hypothetical protein
MYCVVGQSEAQTCMLGCFLLHPDLNSARLLWAGQLGKALERSAGLPWVG